MYIRDNGYLIMCVCMYDYGVAEVCVRVCVCVCACLHVCVFEGTAEGGRVLFICFCYLKKKEKNQTELERPELRWTRGGDDPRLLCM